MRIGYEQLFLNATVRNNHQLSRRCRYRRQNEIHPSNYHPNHSNRFLTCCHHYGILHQEMAKWRIHHLSYRFSEASGKGLPEQQGQLIFQTFYTIGQLIVFPHD